MIERASFRVPWSLEEHTHFERMYYADAGLPLHHQGSHGIDTVLWAYSGRAFWKAGVDPLAIPW